ncbi:MAG: hypothetical protein ACTS7D_01125, partial [Candidatus Hodgkinia cicadicola]
TSRFLYFHEPLPRKVASREVPMLTNANSLLLNVTSPVTTFSVKSEALRLLRPFRMILLNVLQKLFCLILTTDLVNFSSRNLVSSFEISPQSLQSHFLVERIT